MSEECLYMVALNRAWVFVHDVGNKIFQVSQIQSVPSCAGYQKIVLLKFTSPTTIGKCQSIPAALTDIQVVYNMMVNAKKIQAELFITFDEAI